MKKVHKIIIEDTCRGCPFCQYNPLYILGGSPGYICKYPGSKVSRIVDNTEIRENYSSETKGWPPIPEKCPLENVEDKD